MGCPACGSQTRDAIAPGYFRCTALVPSGPQYHAPVPGQPWMVQPVPEQWVPCGTQYQEGGGAQVSTSCGICTTFAIGTCGACGVPVCGDHSRLFSDQRLCPTHLAEAKAATAEAAKQAKLEAEAAHAAAVAAAAASISPTQAATTLFLKTGIGRGEAEAAAHVLLHLPIEQFTEILVTTFTNAGVEPVEYRAPGVSQKGRLGRRRQETAESTYRWSLGTQGLSFSAEGAWYRYEPGQGEGWHQLPGTYRTVTMNKSTRKSIIEAMVNNRDRSPYRPVGT